MVAPLLLAGAGLSAFYNVGKSIDNWRYWSDYYKNTGYFPRYPFRSGAMDWARDFGRTFYSSAYWYRYS